MTDNLALQLFKLLTDDESRKKAKELHQSLRSTMSCYQCALMEVETKFKVLNERFSLDHERNPIDMIKTRIKGAESIREKLQRKGLPLIPSSLEKLDDIAGIRVICSFVDDIYMLSDCLLQQDDIFLIKTNQNFAFLFGDYKDRFSQLDIFQENYLALEGEFSEQINFTLDKLKKIITFF